MFTIGGMKFYGDPDASDLIWSFPADGSDDSFIAERLFVISEDEYNAIRAIQEAKNAPTPEQVLAAARMERDRLLTYATLRINPLQYASDLDEASEEDLALLKLWKKYSSAVNKTETKPGWPEAPAWPAPPIPIETSV